MSGWPWMKGEALAISDAEQDDKDPRPVVKELIEQHREHLDELKAQLRDNTLFDASKHDDLWCLRFLLSHKQNVERAVAAAKTTLQFRQEHSLDDHDIRDKAPQDYEAIDNPAFHRFMTSGVGKDSLIFKVEPRTVVTYLNIGTLDPHKLAALETDDWIAALAYANEWNYQWLDFMTRTTGRLTKSIRIVDVGSAQLSQIDLGCQDKYTTAIGKMQDCFPQAVRSIYVCFAPFWIQGPWRVIRPFLPVRVVTKIDFLNPTDEDEDLQRLLEHVPKDHLPVHFGGTFQENGNRAISQPNVGCNSQEE